MRPATSSITRGAVSILVVGELADRIAFVTHRTWLADRTRGSFAVDQARSQHIQLGMKLTF
jgi:hypothetical protein